MLIQRELTVLNQVHGRRKTKVFMMGACASGEGAWMHPDRVKEARAAWRGGQNLHL